MFIGFVLILLFILLGVLIGVYSIFSPFVQNLGDVIDFNSAYYGALAGIERGNLVLRYKQPGFIGSGGYFGSTRFGPKSDTILTGMGSLTSSNNGIAWKISSRTTTIPSSGNGNVDILLSNTDSPNYNQLPYYVTEKIFLYVDTTPSTEAAYTDTTATSFSYFTGGFFSGYFRLPPKALDGFSGSKLCTNTALSSCDPDGDDMYDDTSVNRSLKGNKTGIPFTILPVSSIFFYSGMKVDTDKDTTIRESIVNTYSGNIYFGYSPVTNPQYYYFNPFIPYSNKSTEHNIISPNPTNIKGFSFRDLLTNSNISPAVTGLEFSFGLVDLLRSTNGNIFPFLEYQLSFANPIADRFFTVEGNSLVGNYNVKIILKKATNRDTPIVDFTIIF